MGAPTLAIVQDFLRHHGPTAQILAALPAPEAVLIQRRWFDLCISNPSCMSWFGWILLCWKLVNRFDAEIILWNSVCTSKGQMCNADMNILINVCRSAGKRCDKLFGLHWGNNCYLFSCFSVWSSWSISLLHLRMPGRSHNFAFT